MLREKELILKVNNAVELLKLVQENPDLPVVPLVNGEICWDDSCHWMGSFGTAAVEYIGVLGDRYYDDQDDFKEAYYDKYSEELCEQFNYDPRCCVVNVERGLYTQEQLEANSLAESALEEYLAEQVRQRMIKAIVVYIGEPDQNLFTEVD